MKGTSVVGVTSMTSKGRWAFSCLRQNIEKHFCANLVKQNLHPTACATYQRLPVFAVVSRYHQWSINGSTIFFRGAPLLKFMKVRIGPMACSKETIYEMFAHDWPLIVIGGSMDGKDVKTWFLRSLKRYLSFVLLDLKLRGDIFCW